MTVLTCNGPSDGELATPSRLRITGVDAPAGICAGSRKSLPDGPALPADCIAVSQGGVLSGVAAELTASASRALGGAAVRLGGSGVSGTHPAQALPSEEAKTAEDFHGSGSEGARHD